MQEAPAKSRWFEIEAVPTWLLVSAALCLIAAIGLWAGLAAYRNKTEAAVAESVTRRPAPVSAASAPPAPPANLFRPIPEEEAKRLNAALPFSTEPLARAAPLALGNAALTDWEAARQCLALAVYHEAGFEPLQGRRAVAQVVLNRVRHPSFPDTVCGVVFQGSELPTGCQFTFTCDGALGRPPEPGAWRTALGVAERALSGYTEPSVGTATHYHTDYVLPYWAPSLVKLTQIGAHIFYRWPGSTGLTAAFRKPYRGGEKPNAEAVAALLIQPEPTPAELAAVSEINIEQPLDLVASGGPAELPPLGVIQASGAAPAVQAPQPQPAPADVPPPAAAPPPAPPRRDAVPPILAGPVTPW